MNVIGAISQLIIRTILESQRLREKIYLGVLGIIIDGITVYIGTKIYYKIKYK
jgi:uncharacterized membrane protein